MTNEKPSPKAEKNNSQTQAKTEPKKTKSEKEIGGYADEGLPEPTRFGDWEVKGRCSDF